MSRTLPPPPDTYPNPRNDDPWDNDAIHWLLEHEDVAAAFTRHNLFECARRQPRRMEDDLENVILAAKICERYGVEQVEVFDQRIGKRIWRLRRTDPGAPEYPDYSQTQGSASLEVTSEDREAARRLLRLLGAYEAALQASGKSKNTVFTYVDRAERFLKRVAEG